MKHQTPFITRDFLVKTVGEDTLSQAHHAMDTLSIRSFKFDRRGRIEAGIRPTPISHEKASYAKISKRGSRYQPECLQHGRGQWCIHTLILALYQLGEQPEFKVSRPEKPPPKDEKSNFSLIFNTSKSLLSFSIYNQRTARPVPHPRDFLNKDFCLIDLTKAEASRLLENSDSEPGSSRLEVDADELAPILFELWKGNQNKKRLLHKDTNQTYTWETLIPQTPYLCVKLEDELLTWQWKGKHIPQPNDLWVPGRPGFRIRSGTITMFPFFGHLSPFTNHPAGASTPENHEKLLHTLLNDKHQVTWENKKPTTVSSSAPFTIKLIPDQHDLMAQIGLMEEGSFIPLKSLEQPRQVLSNSSFAFIPSSRLTQLKRQLSKLRIPSANPHFRIHANRVEEFLNHTRFPESWQILRHKADNWFGMQPLQCESTWDPETDETPSYTIDGQEWEHKTLMDHLLASRKGIRLENGRTMSFDTKSLLVNDDILTSLSRAFPEEKQKKFILKGLLSKAASEPEFPIPKKWHEILRNYQLDGLKWLLDLKTAGLSGLLADDMGLGKTVQTLSFLEISKCDLPQLVIAPRTLIPNWVSEIKSFTPNRVITVHHGPNRTKNNEDLQKTDLVVTTYGTVLRDEDLFYDVHFDTVVLDEAQAIKNPKAKTSLAVFDLWTDSRLALTGTPIENNLLELWSLFEFIAPEYLGPKERFQGHIPASSPLLHAVRKKIKPLTLRRIKDAVMKDLPAKQEITITLPLREVQQNAYHSMLKQSRMGLAPGEQPSVPSLLTMLLRLRQICCHPGLVSDEFLNAESSKFEFLLDALRKNKADGQVALVFSQFTKLLNLFKFQLEEEGIDYLYLDGKTRNRQDLIERFQNGEGSVFLISLKTGGTGLNLTRASYVYHLDPWWNPMVEAQATDRTHRIGQTQKVFSYKLIAEGTIEEAIQDMQTRKKTLARGIWDDTGQTLPTGLNRNELIDLISKNL